MPFKQRRDFFKSLVRKAYTAALIRPPYSVDEQDFVRCISCSAPCVVACETNVIALSYYSTPYLDFKRGACTFCRKCLDVCDKGVLREEGKPAINAFAKIKTDSCLAWNDKECNDCYASCEVKAILFFNAIIPSIDTDTCTGCGMCYLACSHRAIDIVMLD